MCFRFCKCFMLVSSLSTNYIPKTTDLCFAINFYVSSAAFPQFLYREKKSVTTGKTIVLNSNNCNILVQLLYEFRNRTVKVMHASFCCLMQKLNTKVWNVKEMSADDDAEIFSWHRSDGALFSWGQAWSWPATSSKINILNRQTLFRNKLCRR